MKPEEKISRLQEWLGPEFSREELESLLAELPELGALEDLPQESLLGLKRLPVPALRADFTARVMARLEAPSLWQRFRERWLTLPRMAVASVATAAVATALWVGFGREPQLGAPLSVRAAVGAEGQPVYFVRFALKQPGAKQVAVAGDFNQWNGAALTPSADGEFSVELPLGEGTYNYAFVVDGQRWVADPAADRWVDDGFGKRNSVINL